MAILPANGQRPAFGCLYGVGDEGRGGRPAHREAHPRARPHRQVRASSARISASEALRPFIFQLPANNMRMLDPSFEVLDTNGGHRPLF